LPDESSVQARWALSSRVLVLTISSGGHHSFQLPPTHLKLLYRPLSTNDTFTSIQFGNNIALLCDIPVGEGISAISWNP
jgi:hypothetical protein